MTAWNYYKLLITVILLYKHEILVLKDAIKSPLLNTYIFMYVEK